MNRIKACRLQLGYSQKYVAMTLGVKPPSVSEWESGKSNPTPDNLKLLANLFGVTTDYLLGREELRENETMANKSENDLDSQLISMLTDLTPEEFQRVADFIAGMKAARKK